MSEWSRLVWASTRARQVWEPRLHAIQAAWSRIEATSVVEGIRPAGLVFDMPTVPGLAIVPVETHRWAIGTPLTSGQLAAAFMRRDDETVGHLSGYPPCCRRFFGDTWARGTMDTTGQMDGAVDGPIECNILGRWLGVRFVMHLPCSWECEATVGRAQSFRKLWPEQEYRWAAEILSWPVQWSAVNGIAEIVYPVCKVAAQTTKGMKATIRRHGIPPEEAASGVRFPFNVGRPIKILLNNKVAIANGFATINHMRTAHAMVLGALATSPPHGLTVDLGCGDGHLMRQVAEQFHVPVQGIEANPERTGNHADITIDNLQYHDRFTFAADTLMVSARRFEEIPTLEDWVMSHARQVCVYSYERPMYAEMRRVV